jgi:NAD(P)-dependent dehydrogenase (short-subunit alcohol dehydrogenase family)
MRCLRDKVIVVVGGATGIATGIGTVTAHRLAAEGAKVIVGDIAVERLQRTVTAIRDDGGDVVATEFDSTDGESVRGLGRRPSSTSAVWRVGTIMRPTLHLRLSA